MTAKPCYIFDLDGTLADLSHRLHHITGEPTKNWDAFFDACAADEPIKHIVNLARKLSWQTDLVICSGRSDRVRPQTESWLRSQGLFYSALYMRPANDHRHDDDLKLEMLAKLRADGWEPLMAFDDRDRVVAMWRTAGIPCAQVAAGDY